jgi:hypothetical protein
MIFTNFRFHVLDELPGYEGRPDAYQALCYLWDSKEFQQKSQKEKIIGSSLENIPSGRSICLYVPTNGKSLDSTFHKHISNYMLAITTYRSLSLVLHRHP